MSVKPTLWIVYGIALLAGAFYLWWDEKPLPAIHAAARLPAGHLLATGDVRLPGAPRYLRRAIEQGQVIRPSDLADFPVELPVIAAPKGTVPMMLKLEQGGPEAIPAAGSDRWICPAAKGEKPVRLLSVLCGNRGTCLAVAAIPGDRAARIGEMDPKPSLSARACGTPK